MPKLSRIYRTEHGHRIIIQPFENTERGWVSLAEWKGRQNQIWFKRPAEIPAAVEELIRRKESNEVL